MEKNLSANFLTYLEKGAVQISTNNTPSINFQTLGNSRILDILEIPITLSKKPGLIKQLSQAKNLAKNLSQQNITMEIRFRGDTVLKLGKDANPKLAKIVTLSNHIEITDVKKLKKLSEQI
ncbi:MAG: hypothetical protein ACO2Y5_00875 [Nitrosopumilaceae archaeon]